MKFVIKLRHKPDKGSVSISFYSEAFETNTYSRAIRQCMRTIKSPEFRKTSALAFSQVFKHSVINNSRVSMCLQRPPQGDLGLHVIFIDDISLI